MSSDDRASYHQAIERTKAMVQDNKALTLAQSYGLSILNITWEDLGRAKGSAVGPNISDMTIQVQELDPATQAYQSHLMPVIRFPNFSDKTADVPLDSFSVLVGNHKGAPLQKIGLRELLGNLRTYLHGADSWSGSQTSLLAPDRDSHVLVSAQACFLPIPKGGEATFNPVLFNYQSYARNPAVLTILATREGTSVTIIDNVRDGFEAGLLWGQRLFFNVNGQRASLTAQRASDFLEATPGNPDPGGASARAEAEGLNLVLLIQVPLKQRPLATRGGSSSFSLGAAPPAALEGMMDDVEAAVIGHGELEGPFVEIDGLPIERDPNFPIRVTVQFYKGTSNGVVSEAEMGDIYRQISRVYEDGDYVGSLVTGGATQRPTEYTGPKEMPEEGWFRNRFQGL